MLFFEILEFIIELIFGEKHEERENGDDLDDLDDIDDIDID